MDAASTERLRGLFKSQLPLSANVGVNLAGALEHLLQHPGSLARPRVVMHMATAYDLSESQADDLAISLEYFHTASLVFDDLPCMDNAVQRRGATCVHLAFGESEAILAALALVNRAYALLWRTIAVRTECDAFRIFAYVEANLGTEGLLNGQSLDLNYGSLPHDHETTQRIAYGKTVSLIRLSLVLPALLGGAGEREVALLERLARLWGFAYQILDDLKDTFENAAETGKTTARDAALDRPNVSFSIGTPGALHRIARLLRLGQTALGQLLTSKPELCFLEDLRSDLEGHIRLIRQRHQERQAEGVA